MKYIIPKEKIEKIVFRYLDMHYGDLEKYKPIYYEGIVFKRPNDDSEYGVMGWEKPGTLYIHYKLIEEISSMFSMEDIDSKELIGKWVEDRYKLKVVYTPDQSSTMIVHVEDRYKLKVVYTRGASSATRVMLRIDIN